MFDPNKPVAHTLNSAEEMRGQLNGLHDLIVALNAILAAQVDGVNTINFNEPATATVNLVGNTLHFSFDIPRGGVGAPGPPFAQAVVDGVTTLDPSQAATVGVNFDGSNVRFSFGIPRGNDGNQGLAGNNGIDGGQGPQGVQGPPFAQALVDAVNTLDPGQAATVSVNFDGSNVRFTFGIPRGNDGGTGPQGIQGPPGEVTNAALANAISGTSNNTNGVNTLDTPFADPDAETLRQALQHAGAGGAEVGWIPVAAQLGYLGRVACSCGTGRRDPLQSNGGCDLVVAKGPGSLVELARS